MRVVVLIIGLILSFGLFWQSVLVTGLSGMANDDKSQGAGSLGVLMGIMWLVACGFVLAKPRISMGIFVVSALLGFAGASEFPDLQLWAILALGLAALSYLGYRGKMNEQAKADERDALLRQALATSPGTVEAVPCQACGSMERVGARYCGSCGATMPQP